MIFQTARHFTFNVILIRAFSMTCSLTFSHVKMKSMLRIWYILVNCVFQYHRFIITSINPSVQREGNDTCPAPKPHRNHDMQAQRIDVSTASVQRVGCDDKNVDVDSMVWVRGNKLTAHVLLILLYL